MAVKIRRITLRVDEELYQRVQGLQHGFRGHMVNGLLKLVLDAIDRDGDIIIGAIMSGRYKLVRNEEQEVVS